MNAIFSWGYEAPVRQDYTKDDADISNKIRKMKREYVSENHDNFRRPEKVTDNNTLLFNYFEQDEVEMFKRRLYAAYQESEREKRNKSTYSEMHCKQEFEKMIANAREVTAAGKAQYAKRPEHLKMP